MPPDDGEWSFCQQWSSPPTAQEVEVSCSIRMLTAETTKPADNMNRIVSSNTKQYSFITRSPRICRSKSMTREYIYFPILSSNSDNISKSWLRNVKSLSSLQGKDEKQMFNERLKNGENFKKSGKEKVFDVMHNIDYSGATLSENLSSFERNRLTASDRNIDCKLKTTRIRSRKKSLSNEELNTKVTNVEYSTNLCEVSDNQFKTQRKPGKKIKRSESLRAWNPPSNKKPVLSSFKSDYNVLEPKTVVSLSHQFETTPIPNKTYFPNKKKIELYDKNEMKKRRRIHTEPVIKKAGDNTKIRANSLPDENICRNINKTEISPKSVKKLKSDWEKKAEELSSKSRQTSPIHNLSSHNEHNRIPSYDENFIQSARQMQVLNEYKQRASTSVSNLKHQFEIFATPSPNILESCDGSNKSNKHFQYEKCIDETPSERNIPRIVTSSIKSIRMQFEQQSLNKIEESAKLKPTRNISPSKSPPILNLLAKFDPSISCSSQGRDSTTSNGSFSDNDVFSCDENSQSRNEEMENGDIFVSRLREKKKVRTDNFLKQLEKEKEEELKRLKEQRDRDAIMAEKREVERLKKIEEERIKDLREKERDHERRRIEAEREIQRKRLEDEKKKEELQRSIDKEKQRIAIEEEVKRAKKLREDEQRKEMEEREKLELKRIEEEKEIEEFEREKLAEARELMEAELQKEMDEKLKAEEEKIIKLQIERGIYTENETSAGNAVEADVDNLINKFEKSPRQNESDNERSPQSERKPLSRGGSTQSLSNCRPLNPDEMQLFMGMTTSESFMRTQSLRVKPKKNSRQSRMKRSNSMSEKSSPMLIPNKPSTSMGPPVVNSVPSNCRQLRPEEWKFFLGDMTSSKECNFDFSDSD